MGNAPNDGYENNRSYYNCQEEDVFGCQTKIPPNAGPLSRPEGLSSLASITVATVEKVLYFYN